MLDLLKETRMMGYKTVDTPRDPNVRFGQKENNPPIDEERYHRLVGKLIYLFHTRPASDLL